MQSEEDKNTLEFPDQPSESRFPSGGANSKTAKFPADDTPSSSFYQNPQSIPGTFSMDNNSKSEVFFKDRILANYSGLVNKFNTSFENLSQNDQYEQQKGVILQGILEALKSFKDIEFEDENTRKVVKKVLKEKLLQDENVFKRLKILILLREKDRSTRENSIKIFKNIIKFTKKSCKIMLDLKLEVFISFILEREYKHSQVVKERLQCFKLIEAWLEKDPDSFPYLFGQTIASIAKNPEDQQLRKKAIEMILILCEKKPAMGSSIGGVKIMVDTILDVSLAQQGLIRQDLIVHSLVIMINNPDTRVYLRHFTDLNRIFSIFTQADGVEKDPRRDILDKLQLQLNLVSKAIVNMIRTSHGLIYISSSPLGLASLIGALNQPIKIYKQLAILNLFIEIFDVPLYVGGNIYLSSSSTSPGQSQNLLNNYVALLLQAFYHCGVYEALIRVGITTDENSELNRKCRFLLKKIMYLSSNLLPEVPQIASLVNIATDFVQTSINSGFGSNTDSQENISRSRATKIIKELSEISLKNPLEIQQENELFQQSLNMFQLNLLQSMSGMQNSMIGQPNSGIMQQQFTLNDFPEFFMKTYEYFNQMSYGQSMHNQQIISNFQLDLQQFYYSSDQFFDKDKFDQKINLTKVLRFKDFRDWDFTILLELFENDGNLWNQDRLEQFMERTKFFKRLLSFYMPSKERFVKLEWKQENLIFARVGYLLLKTLLKFPIGKRNLIGKNFMLYFTPGAIFEDNDNPFHQKKSFIQDVEQYIEKEFMRFNIMTQNQRNKLKKNTSSNAGFGQVEEEPQVIASNERFFSKGRLNEKMFRELISWLGLFTSEKETLSLISKKISQQNQVPSMQPGNQSARGQNVNHGQMYGPGAGQGVGGVSGGQVQTARQITRVKKNDDNIFGYLRGLVDRYGYYDHLLQIVIHSFDFGINSSPTRELLKDWSAKCSPSLAKSIIEAYRQLYRQGNLDFYGWCLPFLCNFLFIGDENIKKAALSVLEEACFDEVSINFLLEVKNIQSLIKMQCDILQQEKIEQQNQNPQMQNTQIQLHSNVMDLFIYKFLRSEKGFTLLKENGWLDHKIHNWNQNGGVQYIMRLERNIYDGLNINQLNSLVQTHAMSIWIPIYEHSSDFRNEISTLKKFPFQIIVKIENHDEDVLVQESLQTYIEIDNSVNTIQQQQVQIMGNVIRTHSKLSKLPLEGQYFVSACLKLGSQFINHQCKETIEPFWIKTDIGDQAAQGTNDAKYASPLQKFKIIRNGVHFLFGQYYGELGEKVNKLAQNGQPVQVNGRNGLKTFLEQVIFKVQILPQKYKVIETPVHLFGELVKTKKGTELIRQRDDIKKFRQSLLDESTQSQEKRSILWTLGHIGSQENGMRLILETSLVKDIIDMAENAQILSLRGTCIYIIGMMCRTSIGRREIQKHNWLFSKSQVASGAVSVCLPRDPKNLFKVETGTFEGSITFQKGMMENVMSIKEKLPLSKEEQDVLNLIGNLINGVTWQQAYNDLQQIQKSQEKNPKTFMNPRLFEHTILYLSMYNRLQPKTRKFIFNLFDQLIFQNKLLKDRYVNV